ncbi:hypothetical protein CKO24_13105 [Rhodothalassium salexigens DSM 2132]|nr:hypothetical protein [Rhodothalassium salexigens DSM 2132]
MLGVFGQSAFADERRAPQNLMIALDVSTSNVIVESDVMAAKAGRKAAEMIHALDNGDRVHFRTFGSYSQSDNPLRLDITVSRRMPAHRVAASVGRLIASLPDLVASGRLPAGGTTHITAFLEEEAALLSCSTRETKLVLFTDGIEASPETSPKRLADGQATLPAPDRDVLQGCGLSLYGIGETTGGANRARTENLIVAWRAWAEQAGAAFNAFPKY